MRRNLDVQCGEHWGILAILAASLLSAVRGVGLGSAPVARSGAKVCDNGALSYEPDEVETAPARWPFISRNRKPAPCHRSATGRPRTSQARASSSCSEPGAGLSPPAPLASPRAYLPCFQRASLSLFLMQALVARTLALHSLASSQVKGIVRSATRKCMHHHVRGKGGPWCCTYRSTWT